MKIDTIKNGGQSQGGLDNSGGTLTGPLLLSRHPQLPMEAATKQYVDQGVQNLDAGNFTTGTLPIARLPVMGGDVTSEAGSNLMNLVPTGVTAGEYARITVNAKGRAIGTGIISATDLPALPFSKITMDKPTTLSGYGITDAVNNAGGIMTGPLILAGNPSNGDHLVPKQYIDGMIGSLASARTGDVVRKAYATTPVGFLKCNGASVSKTDYSDLYAILGDSYESSVVIGNGRPWQQQYAFNNSQSQDFANWSTSGTIPNLLRTSSIIVTKNRVYLIAGGNDTAFVSTVYTAPINIDGSLGSWSNSASFPIPVAYHKSIVIRNTAYVIGGYIEGSGPTSNIYSAPINSNGTIGTWSLISTLPVALFGPEVLVISNKLYVLGGSNASNPLNGVYSAPILPTGMLGAWVTNSNLPTTLSHFNCAVVKNKIYTIGGRNNGNTPTSNIYSASFSIDGTIGTWSSSGTLPYAIDSYHLLVTKNRIYVLGGYNGSSYVATTISAPINADGTIGTWSTGTSLNYGVAYGAIFSSSSKIYIVSGISGGTGTLNITSANSSGGLNDYSPYYTEEDTNFVMPGSGKPWQQQYQTNTTHVGDITGWSLAGNLPVVLMAFQACVTKNRVYVVGGSTNSDTTIASVYTAPINTDGTLGSWTATTSLPAAVSRACSCITKNRFYLFGGYRGGVSLSSVYYAPINADGTLGSWVTDTSLPGLLAYSQAIYTKNRVYLLGGSSDGGSNAVATVYTAPVNTDGSLGTWTTGISLPTTLGWSQAAVTKNRVYLVAGWNAANSARSIVYSAPIRYDGTLGEWYQEISTPVAIHWHQVFVTKNSIYVLGGWNNSNAMVSTVMIGSLNSSGNLTGWSYGAGLPAAIGVAQVITTNNRIFIMGGRDTASTFTSNIYSAAISGGLNDYSAYYDGTVIPAEPINQSSLFKLPDMSATDVNGIYHYIKF